MTDNEREEFVKPERVQVERRPREHYKAKYINTRGWLLITIAAGIAEAVILIFTLFGKG